MNSSRIDLRRIATRSLSLFALAAFAACGHGRPAIAPSSLVGAASTYDGQDVTVTGTVSNPTTRTMRRGTATVYQLCDGACVSVLQFGDANVSDGSRATVSGRFHRSFGRRRFRMRDVVVVGGRR